MRMTQTHPGAKATPDNDGQPSLIKLARERDGGAEVADPLPLDLGVRVRELRKSRGWTLEQAATQAGLARSTLSKIENGQMSPTYEALKKLAVGLEISVPQLFTPPRDTRVAVSRNSTAGCAMTVRNFSTSSPARSGSSPSSTNPSKCAGATARITTLPWGIT
jgi:DNA-binding XRE family transcriptional regulator